jgi:hypothetical protein
MPMCDEPGPLYDIGEGHIARCYLYDKRAESQRPIEVETAPVVPTP